MSTEVRSSTASAIWLATIRCQMRVYSLYWSGVR
jgi:hypothetical protein